MKYSLFLIFILIVSHFSPSSGQYYNTGQDPSSLKWLQIKTGHFKVIYPESYGAGGLKFARSLENSYAKLTGLFPVKKLRIPVIIHNNTVQSNGYVAWAPGRMEIYPTPEQNTVPLDPVEQLTLHELTHVFQMESLNTGFTKAASFLLGEQTTGAVSSLIPLWYFEGDAVFMESVLTLSGRGRSPSFQKQLKAILLEKDRMYNYDEMFNGSFRNYIPDHYQSGFQMVVLSRSEFSGSLWNKALKFTGDQPFTLNPVNISLRNSASLTKKKLFTETIDTLKAIWSSNETENGRVTYNMLNPPKNGKYISYYSPVRAGTDSIIAIRTSLSRPSCFVLITTADGSEMKLHSPGQVYPYFISYGNGRLVWVETKADPRWKNRNYSVIKMLDIRKNTTRQLTRRTRYLSASVSPDGKMIAAAENTSANLNNLVLIHADNPAVIQTVPAPGNASLQRPEWDESGTVVTFITMTSDGEGVIKYDLSGQNWETLIEPGRTDLQDTFFRNDSLFFISSVSGTENICLLKPDNTEVILTNSRFGATDISIDGRDILFADYSSTGNNICSISMPLNMTGDIVKPRKRTFLTDRFEKPVSTFNEPDKSESPDYKMHPYRKITHLFRFHSWMPFYADIEEVTSDPQTLKPGLTLMSQNSLSTLFTTVGYKYSEKRHQFHSRVSWQGWYPVFDSEVNYGGEPVIIKPQTSVRNPGQLSQGLVYTNTLSLPLVFTSGNFTQYIRPSFSAKYENNYIYIKEENLYDYGQPEFNGRLFFSNSSRSAVRDIYPRLAQVIDLNYGYYPFDQDLFGDHATLKTAFYFPGIIENHGIRFRFELDRQKFRKFYQSNRIQFPRGYLKTLSRDNNINIYSENLDFYSVDYVMPLVYPDLSLASLLYIKRIRGGMFYDFAHGINNYHDQPAPVYNRFAEDFSSFGFDLLADFHLLRIPFMISSGVQTAWRSIGTAPSFELLFSFDIFGMNIGNNRR